MVISLSLGLRGGPPAYSLPDKGGGSVGSQAGVRPGDRQEGEKKRHIVCPHIADMRGRCRGRFRRRCRQEEKDSLRRVEGGSFTN